MLCELLQSEVDVTLLNLACLRCSMMCLESGRVSCRDLVAQDNDKREDLHIWPYMPTPSQNGPLFVYLDVHYDKLYYKTQYLLRSTYITRNTIEDCAGNGSWKCATEAKLPSSKDLESLGERGRNKIIVNKIRRGGRRKLK